MCLECSGRHRGLGVHISFVRSVTMDSWSADQLKKMQCGGNGKVNAFLKQYGVEKHTDIKDKYNSRAAEVGPPPSSGAASRVGSAKPSPAKRKDDDWDSWGDSSSSGAAPKAGAGGGFSSGSEYTRAQLESSAANKESFFARKMQENATRPDHLPPSQGGKYVGFGSAPVQRPKPAGGVDDLSALLSSTLTTVTKVAETAAKTATAAVKTGSATITQTLQEKQVGEALSVNAKVISEKAAHVAQTGFSALTGLYAKVASTVEQAARQQGYALDLGAQRAAAVASSSSAAAGRSGGGGGGYSAADSWGGFDEDANGHRDEEPAPAPAATSRQPSSRPGTAAGKGRGGGGGGDGGFSGFDADGRDGDDGWGWGDEGAKGGSVRGGSSGLSARGGSGRPAGGGGGTTASATHKSKSMPALHKKDEEEEEEWGKW
ncbi:hypothetical protein GPECTOR_8g397 [Gonium pectorale]|uniref:Arf-GAP domain-containing protein n=1 Tax=Gonium pectorale TaxID=33097 RepID=A0A150GUM8_GONPE|nr:hypothetical protein GPECTOR_8g397 [Gonium pectorale]|eukprot:KXZ53030.1 hypothetical protein GPECTOR_8g397 [Gonium pectorale]